MSDLPVTWLKVLVPVTGTSTAIIVDQEPAWLGDMVNIRTGERFRVHGSRWVSADQVMLSVTRDVAERPMRAGAMQLHDDLMLVPT